jgi:hypothetical protein
MVKRSVKRLTFLLGLLGCFLAAISNLGCTEEHYHYPYYVQTQPPPGGLDWPRVTLTGKNSKEVALVRNEFIRLGWDARRIRIEKGGKSDVVKAMVKGGDMDIPVGAIGVGPVAKSAIQGIVASFRPISSGKDCYRVVPIEYWKSLTPDGAVIAEFRKSNLWEYKYGTKGERSIVFRSCVQSANRLDPSGLPWTGDWIPVEENPPVSGLRYENEMLRAWFQNTPHSITIKPLGTMRSKK